MPRRISVRSLSLPSSFALFACLACTYRVPTLAGQATSPDTLSGDVLPLSRVHRIASAINGRRYVLTVARPGGYAEGRSSDSTRYPVLYIMEESAGAFLRMTVPGFRFTHGSQNSGLIIVGVSPAPSPSGAPSVTALSKMDLSPPPFPFADSALTRLQKEVPGAGGAPLFVRVLREEIIPFVERTYRTTSDRGILGMSFSGMFTAYVLFAAPELFTRYAMVSPSLWWNEGSIFRMEEAFANRAPELPKTVYLSTGSNEWPNDIRDVFRLVGVLCDRLRFEHRYAGLEVIAAMNMDEFHVSPVHFARAIEALYPRDRDPRAPLGEATVWPPARVFCGPRAKW